MFTFRKNGHFYERIGKKGEPVCIDDEIPFDIPESWEWTRIKNISELVTKGTTPKGGKSAYQNQGIKFLRVENIGKNGEILLDNIKYISPEIHENFLKRSILKENDLLISIAGALGRTAIVQKEHLPLNTNQAVSLIRWFNIELIFVPFVEKSINSSEIQKLLLKQTKVTAIPNLTLEIIRECLIPFPPLNEQKRIVNKLEEFSPLIEEYGENEKKLDKLNSKFPDKLRNSILQEAIQGKLIPQNPNDEPASILLEKLKEEKERLIKEKKIKKNKKESFIYKKNNHFYEMIWKKGDSVCIDDEIPFEIPETWEWCRLNTICTKLTDGSHNPPPKKDSGIPVLSVKNINQNEIDFNSIYRFTDEEGYNKENPRTNISKGDIILGIVGSIGEVAIYNSNEKVIAQRSIAIIKTEIFNNYLTYIFESNLFKKYAKTHSKGTAQRGLYLNSLKEFLVPIPPLNEQKRIVTFFENILNQL